MNIVSLEFTQMNDDYLKQISDLNKLLFDEERDLRFEGRQNLLFTIAENDGEIIGFKAGYDRKPGHFYSWLGGVKEVHRGKGIAKQLMELQHETLKNKGYKTVQTKTMNRFKGMLILNLKAGFDVSGSYLDEKKRFMIILDKKL